MHPASDSFTALRAQARRAGLLYLAVALIAPWGLVYAPNKLFVAGDPAATAAALAAGESLLRLGIATELLHQTIEVFLVLALYRLLAPVREPWARLMAVLGLLPIPIAFLNTVSEFGVLLLLKDAALSAAFSGPQRDALLYLLMRLHGAGLSVASVFWGLWLLPLGALSIRSGFIPRWIGIGVIIAGLGYVLDVAIRVLAPTLSATLSSVVTPLQSLELLIILWLAVFGARKPSQGA